MAGKGRVRVVTQSSRRAALIERTIRLVAARTGYFKIDIAWRKYSDQFDISSKKRALQPSIFSDLDDAAVEDKSSAAPDIIKVAEHQRKDVIHDLSDAENSVYIMVCIKKYRFRNKIVFR